MSLDVLSAVVAGVVAAQVMETPAYAQRALGRPLRQDVFAEAGILLRAPARVTRIVGWLGHGALAAAIACLYAAFFHLVGEDHLLAWGAVGGLVHFAIGGAVVGALFPLVQHRPDEPGPPGETRGWLSRPHPGFAYRRYGPRDVITFLGGHLTFGVLLGVLYPALHPALGVAAAG